MILNIMMIIKVFYILLTVHNTSYYEDENCDDYEKEVKNDDQKLIK